MQNARSQTSRIKAQYIAKWIWLSSTTITFFIPMIFILFDFHNHALGAILEGVLCVVSIFASLSLKRGAVYSPRWGLFLLFGASFAIVGFLWRISFNIANSNVALFSLLAVINLLLIVKETRTKPDIPANQQRNHQSVR